MARRAHKRHHLSRLSVPAAAGHALAVCLLAGLGGCASLLPPSSPDPEVQRNIRRLEADRLSLQQHLEEREKQIARLQLQDLEQNARIAELGKSLASRERELATLRERLQRTESRAQALTGPAQAAAAVAEAQAAYRVAADQGRLEAGAPAIEELLASATAAWDVGDYAAAADISEQAMRQLAETDATPRGAAPGSAAYTEHPLEQPVRFRVRVTSHVRAGPGMGYTPLGYLPAGSVVTGVATLGRWVKIHSEPVDTGWIFGKLLSVPD